MKTEITFEQLEKVCDKVHEAFKDFFSDETKTDLIHFKEGINVLGSLYEKERYLVETESFKRLPKEIQDYFWLELDKSKI